MQGGNVDILRGKPAKAVVSLALPILAYLLISNLYNIIDAIWITGISKAAIAGAGAITPMFAVVNGVGMGIGTGATSAISYFIGLKDKDKADNVAIHTILIMSVVSLILTVVLLFSLKYYLALFNINHQAFDQGMKYGFTLLSGMSLFIFLGGLTGILRGEGETKKPMIAISAGLILNALLDPFFIYYLGMGVTGAAISTIVTSFLSLLVLVYWIFIQKNTYLSFSFRSFQFDLSIITKIQNVGIPASIELIIMTMATTFYLIFVSSIGGNHGTAVFTVGEKLYYMGIMPISSICLALVPVVGNAFGESNPGKIREAYHFACKSSVILGSLLMACMFLLANPLSFIFACTSETNDLLTDLVVYIRITILCLPFLGIGLPSTFLYQGLGRGSTSLMWTLIRELIFAVFFTYLFGIFLSFGLNGIWVGLLVGRTLANILNYFFARRTLNRL